MEGGGIGKMDPAETVIAATLFPPFPPITGSLGGKGKTVSGGGKGKSGTGKGKVGAGKVRGKGKSGGKGKSHGAGKGKGEAYRPGLAKADSSEKRELQKKAKRRTASWSLFIHRVLRQAQQDSGSKSDSPCSLSQKAMNVLNHCMTDTFDRVVQQATMLTRFREQKTVSAASVVTAIRLMMESDESDKHSILSQCLAMCRSSHEMFNRVKTHRLAAAARKQAEAAGDGTYEAR